MVLKVAKADPHERKPFGKGTSVMFTSRQYRAKATEYGDLAKSSTGSNQKRDFQKLELRFAVLADNEQSLSEDYQDALSGAEQDRPGGIALADEEEHILRCLGAALIMQWNTLPTKLRRELFDNAGSMGALLDTAALRGQIARFLHRHKNNEDTAVASIRAEPAPGDASLHAASIARWDDEGGACQIPGRPGSPKRQMPDVARQ
jgi:hypothetical protein